MKDYKIAADIIRQNASKMDIIFLGANDLIGKLIRFAQKNQTSNGLPSLWSHVCLYVDKETIIESTIGFEPFRNGSRWDNGVEFYSLDERIKSSGYNCHLVKMKLNHVQRNKLLTKAEELFQDNVKYAILGLIGSLLTYYLFPKWKSNPLDNQKRELYCSAFVADVYSSIGYKFSNVYDIDNISPQLLYNGIISNYKHEIIRISEFGELVSNNI